MRRLFIVLLLCVATGHAGWSGPGLAWAEDEVLKTGIDAYLYAYPLVLMDVTRLYIETTTGAKSGALFQGSVLTQAGLLAPGTEILVSAAWLDLSEDPVVLHVSAGCTVQLMDAWTNIVASLSGSDERNLLIVGPSWSGKALPAMTIVRSPTDTALVLVPPSGAIEDIPLWQDRITLTPLSAYGKPDGAAVAQGPPLVTPVKPPVEQVADMDAKTFFTHFARLLASNPPAPADTGITTDLLSLGIVPGATFDFDALDAEVKDLLSRSVEPAQARIKSFAAPMTGGDDTNLTRARTASVLASSVLARLFEGTPAGSAAEEPDLSPENGIVFRAEGRKATEVNFNILEDIARGREFLKDKVAGRSEMRVVGKVTFFSKGRKKERLVARTIVRPNFLLAVEDLKERKIREVLITGRGYVTDGFQVKRIRANGVASRFEVAYPENMAILALKTTVHSGSGLKEVVYTPYSPEIDTKEVRKAGLDYLTRLIKLARSDLAAKRVRLAEFGRGDGIPMEVSLVLSIIEHIDPVRFAHYKGNEIALVHEVLTIIGANTTEAYRYSRSPAGAMGLFQFIPKTYKKLLGKYRGAGLTGDFVAGSTDQVNAAKASLLLFNSDLMSLPSRLWSAARRDGHALGMFIAAAYNCGPARVERSARACKGRWTCRLPEETRVYLEKFDAVWSVRDTLDK